MHVLHGKPISPGYAVGKALVCISLYPPIPRYQIGPSGVAKEQERLSSALERSREELADVQQQVQTQFGPAESEIFRSHLALLADQQFVKKVRERIGKELINVEHALHQELDDLARLLSEVANEYLRERAGDIQDVQKRLMRHLGHDPHQALRNLPPDSVLVVEELLPSDTLNLDRSHVAAIISERGGETSHAAILARSMGIPAVSGIKEVCRAIPEWADLLVDGEAGLVTVAPAQGEIIRLTAAKKRYISTSHEADLLKHQPLRTADGVEVELWGNIGRPEEAALVREQGLRGVGLFRTEYLFLEAELPPNLHIQAAAYAQSARALGDLPLFIRTIDLGGDKRPKFLLSKMGDNPMLGSRGLRLSLAEPRLLRTQLRAIVRARKDNPNIRLLFPMVVGRDDLAEAMEHLRYVSSQEGLRDRLHVGAMIETPSALFQLEAILEMVDSLSIGTNDLVQFMLAADRNAVEMIGPGSSVHPAVLRAVHLVIEACQAAGKPLSICGEAAADAPTSCLFVGLGVRQLSMSPVLASRVRQVIRKQKHEDLQRLADEALDMESHKEIIELLHRGLVR